MSSDPLSPTSTRSSTKSMRIPMPPPQSAFVHPSPAYTIATTPSPSQDPSNASWHQTASHNHHHYIHISTPHPLAATTSFLDKHVPLFAKHHAEFAINREFRSGKREARRSVVDTPIPEVDLEHHAAESAVGAAIHAATAAGAAPMLADSHALDNEAWNAVLAKREAARLRSGSDLSRTNDEYKFQGSDYDSMNTASPVSKGSGSPAVTP